MRKQDDQEDGFFSSHLRAKQKAAVLFMSLPPEMSARLFSELGPEEVQALVLEITRLPRIPMEVRVSVIDEFLNFSDLDSSVLSRNSHQLSSSSSEAGWLLPLGDLWSWPAQALLNFVCSSPEGAADKLRSLWLQNKDEDDCWWQEGAESLALEFKELESIQKASVFLKALPSDLSASISERLPPNLLHLMTRVAFELPAVEPSAHGLILAEFMDGVNLGIPGFSGVDLGRPVVVEAFLRSDPDRAVQRFKQTWLSDHKLGVQGSTHASLSSLGKAAVFFQSISLPCAHRLWARMEEFEIGQVMKAIERLDRVSPATRQEVLSELLGALEESQAEPILFLARLIRCRPDLLVEQLRKLWL